METIYLDEISSTPIGAIWVACTGRGLAAVEIGATREEFISHLRKSNPSWLPVQDTAQTAHATRQIQGYLFREVREFDLQVDWSVIAGFQAQALRLTFAIPYGQVTTYGEIARRLGRPRAARAVGRANATNPMPLVIPCHRVIGADGGLRGYGAPGGIQTKAWLLRLEGRE
jgi:methylated-DNA-[protein]-cysteine S-methyltransferase